MLGGDGGRAATNRAAAAAAWAKARVMAGRRQPQQAVVVRVGDDSAERHHPLARPDGDALQVQAHRPAANPHLGRHVAATGEEGDNHSSPP